MNMPRWNPDTYNYHGDNPFEQFDSWENFLNQFATDENKIIRKGGPGSAIQAGEWYLTTPSWLDEKPNEDTPWFLSYISDDNNGIMFVKLFRDTPPSPNPHPKYDGKSNSNNLPHHWEWDRGTKNGWGSYDMHFKVDFDQLKKSWDFINWISNPFSSVK